jgi:hypothetical protein
MELGAGRSGGTASAAATPGWVGAIGAAAGVAGTPPGAEDAAAGVEDAAAGVEDAAAGVEDMGTGACDEDFPPCVPAADVPAAASDSLLTRTCVPACSRY